MLSNIIFIPSQRTQQRVQSSIDAERTDLLRCIGNHCHCETAVLQMVTVCLFVPQNAVSEGMETL